MSGQTIDYDALARQHGAIAPAPGGPPAGGAIDYDALAKQHGATASTPAPESGVSGFVGNVFGSAGKLIENTVDALAHPIDTLGSLASIPVGLYQKAGGPVPAGFDNRRLQLVDAMLDHLKQRYGSLDAAKKTLYEDPVGAMADLSTALGGVGGLLGKAGEVSNIGALAKAGEVASTASALTDPINLVTKPLKTLAVKGASAAGYNAEDLYRTSLKPRINTPVENVRQMVQTGLENSLPVSESGAAKLEGLLTGLQQTIEQKTTAAAAAGVTIDPGAVASRISDVEQRLGSPYSQVNPVHDRQAILRSRDEFLAEHAVNQPSGLVDSKGNPIMTAQSVPIPADKAQQMKVGTYQQIRDQYEKLSTASIESQKALARGLKEELSSAIPELSGLNETQGKMLDLQPVLENAVNKAANRSGGFKDLVTSAAAMSVAGKPVGAAYFILQKVLEDPAVRSRLAIAINKAQQNNPAKWGSPSVATSLSRVNEYAGSIQRAIEQAQQPNP